MDQSQQQTVLRSIAISSTLAPVSPQDRQVAFQVLEEFKKFEGRIAVCIGWLHQERHELLVGNGTDDATVAVKLYAATILEDFLQRGYAALQENDRHALRYAVITAARQLAPLPVVNQHRILANKLAALLAGLVVRDFPQRWTTFVQDVFAPMSRGGLWFEETTENWQIMGVMLCLECLRLVVEDCTDSDFNAKISTSRRNDVLIGLNEVSSQFLPLMFGVLEKYSVLVQSKAALQNMKMYLQSNGRSFAQMTPDERTMYQAEVQRKDQSARLISDCLSTLERFCASMPLEWMLGSRHDFVTAFLYLLREPTLSIQVQSVACLEQLSTSKMDATAWMRFISQLPLAVSEANQIAQAELQQEGDALTLELSFHRGLSRTMALLVSAQVSYITTDKKILSGQGEKYQLLSQFLRLMVDMIHHPSARVSGEQINTWIALMRDPQLPKTKLIIPFVGELISTYMDHLIRVRWDDVEEGTHPATDILSASWDDEEEYDQWFADFRSKCSHMFRLLGSSDPKVAALTVNARVQMLLARHGNGDPRDHLDPMSNQLSTKSDACVQFEALYHPLDNILHGIPSWTVEDDWKPKKGDRRKEIRTSVRDSLSEMTTALVSWDPRYVWLKFRKSSLLEALKYFWRYDSSTLPKAVQSLLAYLSSPEEWLPPERRLKGKYSEETIGLRKKSGVSLVAIAKHVPQHLVPWLSELSEMTNRLLSAGDLLPPNEMHLYEFLSCVAAAVENPISRSTFIANVLSTAIEDLQSEVVKQSISTVEGFLQSLGITEAAASPSSVTDPENVRNVTRRYAVIFSAVNQLLSVGKRCSESARKRHRGIIEVSMSPLETSASNFPDEGPISLQDLARNDPFVPLWPRILPSLLQIVDVTLRLWHPDCQARLLQDPIQRYALAISDDEAYLSQKHDHKNGGVFGEGGTAGSVVSGVDRRGNNLAPKWSGWLNELRNTCFQLLGLVSGSRALYAPELAAHFPQFVAIVASSDHLRAMEHRHMTQYMKHFVEILMHSCPYTLYNSHLSPIVDPFFQNMTYRFEHSWGPVINPIFTANGASGQALTTTNCTLAVPVAASGGDPWFISYYARSGLFVGDLDNATAEVAVEKYRIEVTRTYCDMLQATLALKGDWALVLANQAKEEQAVRRNDPKRRTTGPKACIGGSDNGGIVNADGTPRDEKDEARDARKLLRINGLCHFLLLENESVAGSVCLSVIECLEYPDAYTCRRCTRICHRILETVAWSTRYTALLSNHMFLAAVKDIVVEPKWMVGTEWDMINLVRDIYCRLVLGQTLQVGGQGAGSQQPKDRNNPLQFEQAKMANQPLRGGGILVSPSTLPRDILARLPGVGLETVDNLEKDMNRKRAAKDQKEFLRIVLRTAADHSHFLDGNRDGVFDRAIKEESVLNQKAGKTVTIPDIPEKLVTQSMVNKQTRTPDTQIPEGLGAYQLFGSQNEA